MAVSFRYINGQLFLLTIPAGDALKETRNENNSNDEQG